MHDLQAVAQCAPTATEAGLIETCDIPVVEKRVGGNVKTGAIPNVLESRLPST